MYAASCRLLEEHNISLYVYVAYYKVDLNVLHQKIHSRHRIHPETLRSGYTNFKINISISVGLRYCAVLNF